MEQFFIWLSNNLVATTIIIVAFGVVVTSITLIYVIAFFQGRSISFWPPQIGARPIKAGSSKVETELNITQPVLYSQKKDAESLKTKTERSTTQPVLGYLQKKEDDAAYSNPIVQKGMTLLTASGKKIVILSNFYGGATATLYHAKNDSKENVIVKVFWRGLMPGSPAWVLFSQELRTAEILTHRNIVKVFDKGLHNGYPFIVMEYFSGGTLRDWLRTHDRIPGPDILAIAGQVAEAIDFAHLHGVIHRDIKPGNILFESGPHNRIALGDFGIARIFGAEERDITAAAGEFVGSPGYLAPEAFTARKISKASDIYSFGVVLYEMISGKIPFDEFQEVYAILRVKESQDTPDIRTYRKNIPIEISERLAQTLSRSPGKRPKTARAVLSGIENQILKL